jgi:chromosome segregation ATPase
MCYIQTKNYEVYINQLSDRLSQVNVELQSTNEEIRILNNRIDSQTKSLTKLQEDNKIQEVLINEARARRKR